MLNYQQAGTFYVKAVKERVYDVNLRIEDILKDPVVIYSRDSTQTTLMKGIYKGNQAVAKLFVVNRKVQALSIIDTEVRFQSYFKDHAEVVQVLISIYYRQDGNIQLSL